MTADDDLTPLWDGAETDAEMLAILAELLGEEDGLEPELETEDERDDSDDMPVETLALSVRTDEEDDGEGSGDGEQTEVDQVEQRAAAPDMFDALFGWLLDLLENLFGPSDDGDEPGTDVVDGDGPTVYEEPIADVSGDTIMVALQPPDDYEYPELEDDEDELEFDF